MSLDPKQEWKILKYELFENKPAIAPYPPSVVSKRQLLLISQCLLADYEYEKVPKKKEFFGAIYKLTMETYFA
jgi:hypothetical protein